MNKTEQIREYFREYGPSSAAECARATGIQASYVHKKTGELFQHGLLNRLNRGLYEYQPSDRRRKDGPPLQTKMARAIRMCPTWTIFDIAQLSGATLKYTHKYIDFLRKSGHVQKIGKNAQKSVFRCTPKVSRGLPIMTQRANKKEAQIQELKDLGWVMMRALRDGKFNQAQVNCGQLQREILENRRQNSVRKT